MLDAQPAFVGSAERFDVASSYETFDPAFATPLAMVQECTVEDVSRAVESASEAADLWRFTPVATRRMVLAAAAELLAAERDHLIDLAIRDTGATVRIAAALHVDSAIGRLRWWAAQNEDVLWQSAAASTDFACDVELAPVGVVACISPYNFPLLSMVGKVAPALFAGNAAVLKPAPQDPLLVGRLAVALRAALCLAGSPVEVVSLITGRSAELGSALVRHPGVGSVSFTGSTAVGREIGRVCGARFTPAVLELGGKGALIARDDADVEAVVAVLRDTWTIQAGQKCRAPTRLLAYPGIHDTLVDRLGQELRELVVGEPADEATDVGPVISAQQAIAIDAAVDAARGAGRTVLRGHRPRSPGWYAAPALVLGCEPGDEIMREEIFGPVVAVTVVRDDDQAVRVANATPYGLTDYVYSADVAAARAVARRLQAGGVGINTAQRYEHAPFGGVRDSGIGREGGLFSLEACTVRRAYVAAIGTA